MQNRRVRMKYNLFVPVCLMILVGVLAACDKAEGDLRKDPKRVALGQQLFKIHCVKCHGNQGQGDPNWRKKDSQGHWPPPPLNGSGHSWHHSVTWLRAMIRDGSPVGQGNMPAWKNQLKGEEITALVAYIQSLWPEKIYQHWLKIEKR